MNVIEALQKEIQSTLVVVMAGGEGKRMGYTGTPKPLIPISGVSLLDRCITFLASNGFKRFVILTRQDKVVEHVSGTDYKVELKVCRDPQVPRVGKGKALAYALRTGCLNPEERILIAFPDDIFTDESLPLRFIASHVEAVKRLGVWASVAVVAALQLPYGVLELDPAGLATKFEEKPRLSIYASTGLYIFEPPALRLLAEKVDLDSPHSIEFENTLLPLLAKERKLHALIIPEGVWIPVNTLKELEEAEKLLNKEIRKG